MPKRLAVLGSGAGTLLEAILEQGVRVELALSDRQSRFLEVARRAGVTQYLVPTMRNPRFDREDYTRRLVAFLNKHRIELVVMAGFMRKLSPAMFTEEAYGGRVLNTHPSLLPAFTGRHAVRDALMAGVEWTGCTVHMATAKLDNGPILAQQRVPVLPGDTVEALHERIKTAERPLLPAVLHGLL